MGLLALLLIIVIVFAASYWHASRIQENDQNLEYFVAQEDSVAVTPDINYLTQFDHPLWKALKLRYYVPKLVVTKNVEGVEFTIIELQHAQTGLLATRPAYTKKTTTIFISPLPEAGDDWKITWNLGEYQTWVDSRHVYLARLNKKIPVKDWESHLDLLAKVVNSLKKKSQEEKAAAKSERVWNTQDQRWIFFWLIVAGIIPGLMAAFFLGEIQHLLRDGYMTFCDGKVQYPRVIRGVPALAYLTLLALPPLGLIRLFYTISRRTGRPGFVLQLSAESILLIIAAVFSVTLAMKIVKWQAPEDGTKRVCIIVPDKPGSTSGRKSQS